MNINTLTNNEQHVLRIRPTNKDDQQMMSAPPSGQLVSLTELKPVTHTHTHTGQFLLNLYLCKGQNANLK